MRFFLLLSFLIQRFFDGPIARFSRRSSAALLALSLCPTAATVYAAPAGAPPAPAALAQVVLAQAPSGQTSAPGKAPAAPPSRPGAAALAPAGAVTAPSQAPDPGYTITRAVNEVNLIFTVTDTKGEFIKDLQQQNFGLLDDRKPPERVYNFTQQTNLPLRVGIMLDTSSSIRGRFKFEQDAAKEFLLQVLRPGQDKAFVEGFDVDTEMSQPFSNNIDLLSQGISKLQPGGGTALYDALYKTCRNQMLTLRDPRLSVRKAIVLVSDGDDNYSHSGEQDAIQMCLRAETILYTISTDTSPSKDKGDDVLKAMAQATGGRAFFPKRMEDISTYFHDIEDELRSQYSLEYKPADFKADGSFRSVYLVALNRKYVVRVRQGYYAPN